MRVVIAHLTSNQFNTCDLTCNWHPVRVHIRGLTRQSDPLLAQKVKIFIGPNPIQYKSFRSPTKALEVILKSNEVF